MNQTLVKTLFVAVLTLIAGTASAAPLPGFNIGDNVMLDASSIEFAVQINAGASSGPPGSASDLATFDSSPEFTVKITGSSTLTIDIDLFNDASTGPFVRMTFLGSTGAEGAFKLILSDLDFAPVAHITAIDETGNNCCDTGFFAVTGMSGNSITFTGDAGGLGDVASNATSVFGVVTAANAPEPGTLALLGLALAITSGYVRRGKKS